MEDTFLMVILFNKQFFVLDYIINLGGRNELFFYR